MPSMAGELGIGALHIKDEGFRLGLGSFKALGGSYAVIRLVLEAASAARLGRAVGIEELRSPEVREIARTITVACATDGNHGRSVAQGAGRWSGLPQDRPRRGQPRPGRGDGALRRRDDPRRRQL